MEWVLIGAGLGISAEVLRLRRKITQGQKDFWCDTSEHISCSKSIKSPYHKLFLWSNAWWGVVFYAALSLSLFGGWAQVFEYLTALGVLGSLFLAFISFGLQKNICLLCTSIYIINSILFVFAW